MVRTHDAPSRVAAAWVLAIALILAGAPRPATAGGVGWVTGVVTAAGAPLAAAWVVLTPVTESGDWAGDAQQVATDGSGRYLFEGIAPGHAKLHVRAPLTGDFVATFWPGVYTFGQAGMVPVTQAGFVADIDLPMGRSVSGRVVAEDTGEPVEGAQAVARIVDAPWAGPAGRIEPPSAPGRFEISGLPPVPVRLHVQVAQDSPFLGDGLWSDGTGRGRRVDEPGDISGLVIRLPRGAEVAGAISDGRGHPVAGATVRIENCSYGCPRETTTDGSGAYRIRGIPPSTSLVAHAAIAGALDQWFDRANDPISATQFALGPGEVRSGVDFILVGGGVLLGRVVAGDTGETLSGVPSYLESVAVPGRRYFSDFGDAPAGSYRIGPVPPDTYRLVVQPNSSQAGYRPARWLSATGIDRTGIIRIGPGQETEVVVTLARTHAAADCASATVWKGLFRGFLAPGTWPVAPACVPTTGALGSTEEHAA